MNLRLLIVALVGAAFLFASCQGCQKQSLSSADALSTIPADATAVVRIQVPELMKKADFESLQQTKLYLDRIEEAEEENPVLADVLREPQQSGVDLDQNAYVWYDVNPEAVEESMVALVVSIKDAEAFEKLLRSQITKEPEILGNNFRYVESDRSNAIAWNDQFAVFGNADLYLDMKPRMAKLFGTQASASVAQDKNLQKAFQATHDFTFWLNSNAFATNPQAQAALGLAEINAEALKDNFIHGFLDFLQGEIVGEASYFLHPELTKEIDLLFNDEVKTDFGPFIPEEGLTFAFTNALNIQGIDELLARRTQSKGLVDFSLKQYGITTEDITATFSGDILLYSYKDPQTGKSPGLFATQIKDRSRLQKLLDLGIQFESLEKEGDNRYKIVRLMYPGARNSFDISFSDGFARLLVTDDMLFVSGSEPLLDEVSNGGFPKEQRASKSIQDLLAGHIFGGYLSGALSGMDANLDQADIEESTFHATREKAVMRLGLKEKQLNALKALIDQASRQYDEQTRPKEQIEAAPETEAETI